MSYPRVLKLNDEHWLISVDGEMYIAGIDKEASLVIPCDEAE